MKKMRKLWIIAGCVLMPIVQAGMAMECGGKFGPSRVELDVSRADVRDKFSRLIEFEKYSEASGMNGSLKPRYYLGKNRNGYEHVIVVVDREAIMHSADSNQAVASHSSQLLRRTDLYDQWYSEHTREELGMDPKELFETVSGIQSVEERMGFEANRSMEKAIIELNILTGAGIILHGIVFKPSLEVVGLLAFLVAPTVQSLGSHMIRHFSQFNAVQALGRSMIMKLHQFEVSHTGSGVLVFQLSGQSRREVERLFPILGYSRLEIKGASLF